jgi:hypothetical protein
MPALTENLLELARSAKPEDAVKLRAVTQAMDRGGLQVIDQSRVEIEQNIAIEAQVDVRMVADRISALVGYRVDLEEGRDYQRIEPASGLVEEKDATGPRRQGRSMKAVSDFVPAPMKPKGGDDGTE